MGKMASDQSPAPRRQLLLIWLRIDPSTRPGVYMQIFAAADIGRLSYWLEIFFSAGIATFGLVLNSPAVIIGAMLISPLMGPIMATGLALAVGDLYLGIKAIVNLILSIAASIAFSGFLVWLLPFHSETAEIISRTKPNLLDLGVALLSGFAGSILMARSGAAGSGGMTALPGVAIAVALMPPLCTMGFGLGSGSNLTIMGGAGLLFLTNLIAIVASAFVVFLLVGMDSDDVLSESRAVRTKDLLARLIFHGRLERVVTTAARLRWRVLMVVVVLGSLAVPLRKALLQVADETSVRGVVQGELRHLVASDTVVSQDVRIEPSRVVIHVISTQPISDAKTAEMRRSIQERTRRSVDLSVEAVASRTELADLLDRMRAPVPVASPSALPLQAMQKELAARIQPALEAIWPSAEAPIQNVSMDLSSSRLALHVRYEAATDINALSADVILKSLRDKLGSSEMTLTTERTPPARLSRRH